MGADTRQPVHPKEQEKAPFTLADIKAAIPKHCFERSLVTSLKHVAVDTIQVILLFTAMWYFLNACTNFWLRLPVQLVYTAIQGTVFTGLWVLAHECGHGAFSPYQSVNDVVGFLYHTMLFVPYYAWQFTHASHHHYTNNMEKDEVWVPSRELIVKQGSSEVAKKNSHFHAIYTIFVMFTAGWPAYILANATGHTTKDLANHFNPDSSIFENMNKKDRNWKIHAGTVGIVAWTMFLLATPWLFSGMTYSLLFRLYVLPLTVNFFFLTSITFLQHTDRDVPHYNNEEWNWLRGALATIDRDMGAYLNWQLHDIHHTHVCHHIFSKLPFYHSREATAAFKKVLGEYYRKDDGNYFVSLYQTLRNCKNLSEEEGVLWWINRDN